MKNEIIRAYQSHALIINLETCFNRWYLSMLKLGVVSVQEREKWETLHTTFALNRIIDGRLISGPFVARHLKRIGKI